MNWMYNYDQWDWSVFYHRKGVKVQQKLEITLVNTLIHLFNLFQFRISFRLSTCKIQEAWSLTKSTNNLQKNHKCKPRNIVLENILEYIEYEKKSL